MATDLPFSSGIGRQAPKSHNLPPIVANFATTTGLVQGSEHSSDANPGTTMRAAAVVSLTIGAISGCSAVRSTGDRGSTIQMFPVCDQVSAGASREGRCIRRAVVPDGLQVIFDIWAQAF